MRALAENAGELGRIGEGLLPEQVLTVGIERIVERRIDQLDAAYLPMLEFAATLGRRLDLALMAQAFPAVALRPFLVQCANAAVLEPQGNEWRFAHDKLREAILRRISSQQRRALHRRISEHLEAAYKGPERDKLSAQLAFHCAQGQRLERAVVYYAYAGDQATRLGLWAEARNHYSAALAALADTPAQPQMQRQHIDLLLNLVHCSQIFDSSEVQLHRIREAQNLLDELAQKEALQPADRRRQVRLDYLTGRAHYYTGNPVTAIALYQRVLSMAEDFADPEITAMPSAVIGMALASQGHFSKAHSYLLRAMEPLRQVGNEFELIRTQMYAAMVMAMNGQYRAGMAEFQRGELRGRALEQPQLLSIVRVLRALTCRSGMDWPAMLELSISLGTTAEKLGEKLYLSLSLSMEAWALAQLGRLEESGVQRRKALAVTEALGGKHIVSDWFAANDAETALLAGNAFLAQNLAREVVRTSTAENLPLSWGIAERAWGAALGRLGEDGESVNAHMQESLRILNTGGLLLEIAQTELWWGRILSERQDAGARPHLHKALTLFESAGCEYAVAEVRKVQVG